MTDIVKAMVLQYRRNGVISDEYVRLSEFGSWTRATPTTVMVVALGLWIHGAFDNDFNQGAVRSVVARLRLEPPLDSGEATAMIGAFMNDNASIQHAEAEELGSLRNYVALLSAAWDFSYTEEEFEEILAMAERGMEESAREGDFTRARTRDGAVGPWDHGESFDPGIERIDFGGLRIPRMPNMEIQSQWDGESGVAVTFKLESPKLGLTCMQLQAFHAPMGGLWDDTIVHLLRKAEGRGGKAVKCMGILGHEIRAELPYATADSSGFNRVRFVGCDGPGWLLRGVISGARADADIIDGRLYRIFVETVLNLNG